MNHSHTGIPIPMSCAFGNIMGIQQPLVLHGHDESKQTTIYQTLVTVHLNAYCI